MNKNYTHLVLVVDRSGSMGMIKDDAQGGINQLLEDQGKLPGECTLTLAQFDEKYERVFDAVNLNQKPEYELKPRGGTALYDAVGKTINTTGYFLSSLKEESRPGLVLFAIITDGQENSSREYDSKTVKKMIEHQKNKYNWEFTFLCADEKTFNEGKVLGFGSVAQYNPNKSKELYGATNAKFARMRGQSMSGQAVDNNYSAKELGDIV